MRRLIDSIRNWGRKFSVRLPSLTVDELAAIEAQRMFSDGSLSPDDIKRVWQRHPDWGPAGTYWRDPRS